MTRLQRKEQEERERIQRLFNSKVDAVAEMMAAAYWRGRLHNLRTEHPARNVKVAMLQAAAKADKPRWIAAAKQALSF